MKFSKLLAFVLAAVLTLSFAACGNVPDLEDESTLDDFTVTEPEETKSPEEEESSTGEDAAVTPPADGDEKDPVESQPTETLFDPDMELDLTGSFAITFELDMSTLYQDTGYYDDDKDEFIAPEEPYTVENMSMDMSISYLAPKQFSVTVDNEGSVVALVCVNDIVYMDMMGEKAAVNISDESIEALRASLDEALTSEDAPAEIAPIVDAAFDFVTSLLDGKVTGADMNALYAALAPYIEEMTSESAETMDEATKAFMDTTEALINKLAAGEALTEAELDEYAAAVSEFLTANGTNVSKETVLMAMDVISEAAMGTVDAATLTENLVRLGAAIVKDVNGTEITEDEITTVVDALMNFATGVEDLFAGVEITDLIGVSETTDEDGNTIIEATGLTDLAFDKISAFIDLANTLVSDVDSEAEFLSAEEKAEMMDDLEAIDADHLSMSGIIGENVMGAGYTVLVDGDILNDPDFEETLTLTNSVLVTWTFEDVTVEAPADAGSYTVVSLADLFESASQPSAPEYDDGEYVY